MQQIQLFQVTPEQLQNAIVNGVKTHLDDLKKNFQPKEPTTYLSRQETADLLKVDLSTLWNWQKKGILIPKGIGNRVLYDRKEVDNAIVQLKK